jgi:transposase-like protein
MAMGDETQSTNHVKWQDLGAEERLALIEQVWQGRVTKSQLCRTFQMSRQVLHKAMQAVTEAATQALEPRRPGRKPPTEQEERIAALEAAMSRKDFELKRAQQKYEVAQALLDLQRKLDHGEPLPREGKKRGRKQGS